MQCFYTDWAKVPMCLKPNGMSGSFSQLLAFLAVCNFQLPVRNEGGLDLDGLLFVLQQSFCLQDVIKKPF